MDDSLSVYGDDNNNYVEVIMLQISLLVLIVWLVVGGLGLIPLSWLLKASQYRAE